MARLARALIAWASVLGLAAVMLPVMARRLPPPSHEGFPTQATVPIASVANAPTAEPDAAPPAPPTLEPSPTHTPTPTDVPTSTPTWTPTHTPTPTVSHRTIYLPTFLRRAVIGSRRARR